MRFALMARGRAIALLALAAACSSPSAGSRPDDGSSAQPRHEDAAVADLGVRPLGKARLDDFDWRRGPGRESFSRAVAAEKASDWAAAVAACTDALAADPGHLDASWLLAAALARQGKLDEILAPLEVAAAGDWAKWGERSLDLALFDAFRHSPTGAAWVRAGERYRAAYAEALAASVIVLGRTAAAGPAGAELFAYDRPRGRWLRLTRTGGAVAAVVDAPGAPLIAYVAYRAVDERKGGAVLREVKIGVVDRASGRAGREVVVIDAARVRVAWRPLRVGEPRLEVEAAPPTGKPERWRIDWRRGTRDRLAEAPRGEAIELTARGALRQRLPVAGVEADWDGGVASAFRVETSRKTVTPPALVDGHTLAWSPDRARLAFATAAADRCGEGDARVARVFAVDAATGRLREVGSGDGPVQLRWVDATHVAYAASKSVRVVDVASGDIEEVAGGGGVAIDTLAPRRDCAKAAVEEAPFAAGGDVDEWEDEEAADAGNAPPDAGVAKPSPGVRPR